jgi:hypothetical protein
LPADDACGPGGTCSAEGACAGATAWSRVTEGEGAETIQALAACDGGIVVAGNHVGALSLGAMDATGRGIWVARFEASGALAWSRAIPGSLHAAAIACRPGGAVVAGSVLDAGDAFVATVDPDGHVLHAFGGPGHDLANAVVVDAGGRIVVAGAFVAPIVLGDRAHTTRDRFAHPFAAALDENGEVAWSWTIASAGNGLATSLAATADGDVVVGGAYNGPGRTSAGTDLGHERAEEGFVARLDPSGAERWLNVMAGFGSDGVRALAAAEAGDVVAAGFFTKTLHAGGALLDSLGCEDVFVARYGPAGEHRWSTSFGDEVAQLPTAVAVAGDTVVVGGDTFGDIDLRVAYLPFQGDVDAFAAVLEGSTPSWGALWGDGAAQRVAGVAILSDRIVVAGHTSGAVDFGVGALATRGPTDGFLAAVGR